MATRRRGASRVDQYVRPMESTPRICSDAAMPIETIAAPHRARARRNVGAWTVAVVLGLVVLNGCKEKVQAPAPPPAEVTVIELRSQPVTVFNEYVAQTQSPDTIEIRSQVTGL